MRTLAAYRASEQCPITGAVFQVVRDGVDLCHGWTVAESFTNDGMRFSVDELDAQLKGLMTRWAKGDPRLLSKPLDIGADLAEALRIGT